jgi:hypothetical protein
MPMVAASASLAINGLRDRVMPWAPANFIVLLPDDFDIAPQRSGDAAGS